MLSVTVTHDTPSLECWNVALRCALSVCQTSAFQLRWSNIPEGITCMTVPTFIRSVAARTPLTKPFSEAVVDIRLHSTSALGHLSRSSRFRHTGDSAVFMTIYTTTCNPHTSISCVRFLRSHNHPDEYNAGKTNSAC